MITTRERFRQVMRYGPVDRVPLLDEGFRDDTLAAWRTQGMPRDRPVEQLFHYDTRFVLRPDLYPHRRVRCRQDLEAFRRALDPRDPSRQPGDLPAALAHPREACVIGLHVHAGLFQALGVEDWSSFRDAVLLLADDPGLVREALDIYAEFVVRITSPILDRVEVDYVSFSEPIGATRAPLVSPAMYRDLALPGYRTLVEGFNDRGVECIVFTTYANARVLLPDVVDAGFTALWAMEAETPDMAYRDIRREFGRSLCLVGGIDLDVLAQGTAAIRRELATTVPPLLASGGYIPLADGRVRRTFPYTLYKTYRELLEQLAWQGGRPPPQRGQT